MIHHQERLTNAWEMLTKIRIDSVLATLYHLETLCRTYQVAKTRYKNKGLLDMVNEQSDFIRKELEKMDLQMSIKQVDTLQLTFTVCSEDPESTVIAEKLYPLLEELKTRIRQELECQLMYRMDTSDIKLIEDGTHGFENGVLCKFEGARSDIQEAAKCMAFERYTACVFHLSRPMETAVRIMGERMGVAVTYKEKEGYLFWGTILNNMSDRLAALKKSDRDEHQKWVRVHGMLECVKVAWRNDTMHPGTSYDKNDAREVFDASRTFLKHLAKVLDS